MADALRKVLSFSFGYLDSFGQRHDEPPVDEEFRLGKYRVDYKMPSREEFEALDRELQELFANSKIVSVKRET
jgi:hypothetical protein